MIEEEIEKRENNKKMKNILNKKMNEIG